MECAECETGGALRVTVEYTVDRTENLPLCYGCWGEFVEGEFVRNVSPSD